MNTSEILHTVGHRPFPLPGSPWVMKQIWNHLLFAHWPLAPQILRPLLPPALPLDLFEGQCWVSITPFYMMSALVDCIHFLTYHNLQRSMCAPMC